MLTEETHVTPGRRPKLKFILMYAAVTAGKLQYDETRLKPYFRRTDTELVRQQWALIVSVAILAVAIVVGAYLVRPHAAAHPNCTNKFGYAYPC